MAAVSKPGGWPPPAGSRATGWRVASSSSPEIGLLRLESDAFVPASDDGLFHRASVRSVLAEPDDSLLIATFHDGLFTLRDGFVTSRDSECSHFLKIAGIAKMLRLHDGSMAVATDSAGFLLLDPALRFRSHTDNVNGLHGTNIYNLFEDAEGGGGSPRKRA